jgi:DNA-binding CsgD family transcriptional regulator
MQTKRQGPPQNQDEFDQRYEQLSPRNKEILLPFLSGYKDEKIAKMTFGTKANVRYHRSRCYQIFGLSDDSGYSHQDDLLGLFQRYRKELVSPKVLDDAGYDFPKPDVPGRPMWLESSFYLKPSLEDRCCEEVLRPGQLIRIRAPQMFGKTSLLYRILDLAQKKGYKTIGLNLRYDVDESAMSSLATFLTWFCQEIATYLELPIDHLPTTKAACNAYFQQQVLPRMDVPLVVALDEVEVLFEYPAIAQEFFAMLRGWHEKAKSPGIGAVWEKLRLIIVHSTDDYIRLNTAQSPFKNVGHIAWPKPLQIEKVKILVHRYGLQELMADVIEPLRVLVGGHPYLIQQGLYSLWCRDTTGEDLLRNAPTSSGIYRGHFQDLAVKLESTIGQSANLVEALRKVLQDSGTAKLSQEEVFKLEGLGLVRPKDNQAHISCDLYRRYFQAWL